MKIKGKKTYAGVIGWAVVMLLGENNIIPYDAASQLGIIFLGLAGVGARHAMGKKDG